MGGHSVIGISEEERKNKANGLQKTGGWLIITAIMLTFLDSVGLSVFLCLAGIFCAVAGSIMHPVAQGFGSKLQMGQEKMVLKQNESGEWKWVQEGGNALVNQSGQPSSFAYNSQENQTLGRIISQVRGGKNLQELDSGELSTLAHAYGVQGQTDDQRIQGLISSPMASKALKIGMVAAGGVAALGGASIVAKARKEAKKKALAAKESAKKKAENKINSAKESAKKRAKKEIKSATDMLTDDMIEKIKTSGITPSEIMKFADFNNDNRIDAIELSGAMTAALGISVPVIVIQAIIREFDVDGSESLGEDELNQLWSHLGLELEEKIEEEESEEIPEDGTEEVVEEEDEEIVEEEDEEVVEEDIVEEEPEREMHEIELTDGIDTELEKAILLLEQARLTSERRSILEGNTTEHVLTLKIEKIERTLLGESGYRGGQSLHGLIDGGPYSGLIQLHTDLDDEVMELRDGDEIKLLARLVDYKQSLKRPVLKADSIQG